MKIIMLLMCAALFARGGEYDTVIHPSTIWNKNARWFMYAPALEFIQANNATEYRFTIVATNGITKMLSAKAPRVTLDGVWSALPVGWVNVKCEAVAQDGSTKCVGERRFWKARGFEQGSYGPRVRPYAEAAKMIYDYVFNRSETKYLLEIGKFDMKDPINSYASKAGAALIRAMVHYAELEPTKREQALAVARAAAKYLLESSEKADAPLANFPQTYLGPGEAKTGIKNAGLIMTSYPASVASAYVQLYKATQEKCYLEEAEKIARTYLKLQGADGTWFLKVRAADGKEVNPNRLVPMQSTVPMFDALFDVTGKREYRRAADRAFAYIDNTRLQDWNWEGQFEDVPPSEKYNNLTKHDACATAIYIGKRFKGDKARIAQMREIIRFTEDQFVCWEPPCNGETVKWAGWKSSPTYKTWHCPSALEQYNCYWPIDASAAKVLRTYLALYKAEGNPIDLAKARALGDTMTRVQKVNGCMPTWWATPNCSGQDWVNCMIASARALEELATFDE